MREILFRGKRKDNGKWVYGFYALFASNKGLKHGIYTGTENGCVIPYEVDPETIGQFTGLTDRNGKKIFEGDIVKGCWGTIFSVYYDVCYLQFRARRSNGSERAIDYYNGRGGLEVIGNIYDSPELLGEQK